MTLTICNKCNAEMEANSKKSFFAGVLVEISPQITISKGLVNPAKKIDIHICDKCLKPLMEFILNDDKNTKKF